MAVPPLQRSLIEAAHFEPVSAAVIGDAPTDGEYPSDHFGVAASIRLR